MSNSKKIHLIGTFMASKKGYGFVSVEGIKEDFFISKKFTENAIDGDTVKIILLKKKRGSSKEAKIIKIVDRKQSIVVGVYEKSRDFGFVLPYDTKLPDIYIKSSDSLNAGSKDVVLCNIISFGDKKRSPVGKITEIIGRENDPYVDVIAIAKGIGIPLRFPKEVMIEADNAGKRVSHKEKRGRLDLTKELIITIDGDDSKDLDDAISLKREKDLYILGVHIADVSHYVKERSALDNEAYKRGTSVYLIDTVIPMLPKALSNNICSLLENKVRLTLSCIMKINANGEVVDYSIQESVIKNSHRLTYNKVNSILDNPKGRLAKKLGKTTAMLLLMQELAGIIREHRRKQGSIDFDIPEAKIKLNDRGYPIEISKRDRGKSECIIEDFMLMANTVVAGAARDMKLPILYRSHPGPDQEKVDTLAELCYMLGITLKKYKGGVKPKEIQRILNESKGKEYESLLAMISLRSMQQAKYDMVDSYHFGLAMDCYCHFTSPIRRYPDLLVHRILKENLIKPIDTKRKRYLKKFLQEAEMETSRLERRAVECEREVDKLKKCEFMETAIDEEFTGFISGVTGWGIYVTLDNTVEGMVPIHSIPNDYFIYDEKRYQIIGERTKKTYKLGDIVNIKIYKIDKRARTIDFRIAEDEKSREKADSK